MREIPTHKRGAWLRRQQLTKSLKQPQNGSAESHTCTQQVHTRYEGKRSRHACTIRAGAYIG